MGAVSTSGLVSHISRCGEEIVHPCPPSHTEGDRNDCYSCS